MAPIWRSLDHMACANDTHIYIYMKRTRNRGSNPVVSRHIITCKQLAVQTHTDMKEEEEKRSTTGGGWMWTVLTQVSLCFALLFAFNINRLERSSNHHHQSEAGDVYFLSVRGGIRPPKQQTHLLNQMEKVAKISDVRFIINISELGEDDPFMQNGMMHFQSLKVPWYNTNTMQGRRERYFEKKIVLQYGKILDLIVVDTGSLQDNFPKEKQSDNGSVHLEWLTRTLQMTNSDWRIVVGYDPMLVCGEHGDAKKIQTVYKPLSSILTKFGADVYLSKQSCTNQYIRDGSITHIGNLSPADQTSISDMNSTITSEMYNGFFLHKVNHLEIISYFINSASEVVFRSALHQRGKAFM